MAHSRRNGFAAFLFLLVAAHVALAAPLYSTIFTIDSSSTIAVSVPAYGSTGQGSGGEGAVTGIRGNFLVTFDPLDGTPDTIQFELGHGYVDAQLSGVWLPGIGGSSTPDVADIGLLIGPFQASVRDLVWDWTSGSVANNGDNTFNASSTGFSVISMTTTTDFGTLDSTGFSRSMSNGLWSLSQSGDEWTLSLNGHYLDNTLLPTTTDFALSLQAKATFSAANVQSVTPDASNNANAEALGGAGGQPGGVSVTFNGVSESANFSAQQLPDTTGFSLESILALANNNAVILSTQEAGFTPQFWEVNLSDDEGADVDFGTALLQLQYDDSNFAPGFNEQSLGIWHFNSELGDWESFSVADGNATLDTVANTITFEVANFSELQLGVFPVPETRAVFQVGLCAAGMLLLTARRWVRTNVAAS